MHSKISAHESQRRDCFALYDDACAATESLTLAADDERPQNFFAFDHESLVSKEITLEPPKKSDILPLQLRTPFGVRALM